MNPSSPATLSAPSGAPASFGLNLQTLLRLSTVVLVLGLGVACSDVPPVYTEDFDRGALCWTSGCDKNQVDDVCAPGNLDHDQAQSAPRSLHLYQRASCVSPPHDGVTGVASKTIELPNGTYQLSYKVRSSTRSDDASHRGTGGGTSMSANGTPIEGVDCRVDRHGTCTENWTTRQGCFNVTEGTADLRIRSHSGACAETDGWVDDIAILPLEPFAVQFPADVIVACGAWTAPADLGTASATGGCAPQVSYDDGVEGSCPGMILRTWRVVDAGVTRTQVQVITLLDRDSDDDDVNDARDACANSPFGSVVDARGCTCEQRVELACPSTATWRNHGAYVSCVGEAANFCVAGGLINEAGKDAIVSAAVHSDIGKKGT